MPNQLTESTFKQDLKTDLTNTQQQIMTFIEDMQPVHRKVVDLNADSYARSTIYKQIDQLKEKNMLHENSNGGLTTK